MTSSYQRALEAGYSPEEINTYLSKKHPRYQEALDAGYTPEEITSYLDKKKQPKESLGGKIGRHAGRTGARIAETVLGAPRAFGEFLEGLVPEQALIRGAGKIGLGKQAESLLETTKKIQPYKLFPKSEDIRKNVTQGLFGEKLEPQNKWERKSDELVSDFAALAIPVGGQFKLLRPAITALGGVLASEGVGALGGSEKQKGYAKLGTILFGSLFHPKAAENLKNQLYSDARKARPADATVPSEKLVKNIDSFEKELLKGDPAAGSKKKSLDLINKIREKINKPSKEPVFHGTQNEFKEFDVSNDLGYHFSKDRNTAKMFALEGEEAGRNGRIIEANLNIKNPIKMPDMAGWYPTQVAEWIDNQGLTTFKRQGGQLGDLETKVFKQLEKYPPGSSKGEKEANEIIKNFLKKQGYDSIEYVNKFEGKPVESFIVFEPEQIKQKSITSIEKGKEGFPKKLGNHIEVEELESFKRDINEARSGLFDEFKTDKIGRKAAKRNLDTVSKFVDQSLYEYGKQNPEWEAFYRPANEVHGAIASSHRVRNSLKRHAKSLGFPAVLAELGLYHGAGIGPALGVTGATAGALGTGEILSRVMKSPTLRKHYNNLIIGALKDDVVVIRENLKKLNDELNK